MDKQYWLFFYDDLAPSLNIAEYGTLAQIRKRFNELVAGCHYVRQWVSDGMTWLDFGSHCRFFKIYPAVDFFNTIDWEDQDGLQSRDQETE